MTIAGARLLVSSPSRTPLPYGLLSVAQVADDDPHWRLGIRFETDTCSRASITTESCPATGGVNKSATDTWVTRGAFPVTVYTMPVCSPIGTDTTYESRVVAALTSGEGRAIEREFWTGENGTLPHLAANTAVTGTGFDSTIIEQTAATIITGAPVDIVEGLGLLEQALATCYGNEGVIHVPQIALAHLAARGLIRIDGARLRSPAGHLIAAGAGYPGTAPDGSVPVNGVWYVYATGAITVHRTPIEVQGTLQQAVDKSKNDVYLVAERTYVIGWDCCHYAQPISMGGIAGGAVGLIT